MKRTVFQHPELRDANDNIIQEGTYGKESPLANSDNTGVLDYINNNLEALHDITQSFGVLPGTVTAFSGTFNNGYPVDKNTGLVNREWHLCDGTNGTPDLRNRFIYGGDGTNNGSTGGEATHTLTEAELPKFTPSIRTSAINSDLHSAHLWHGNRSMVAAGWDDAEMRTDPFNTIGGNQPHNNMPPYYTLAFIMKL